MVIKTLNSKTNLITPAAGVVMFDDSRDFSQGYSFFLIDELSFRFSSLS